MSQYKKKIEIDLRVEEIDEDLLIIKQRMKTTNKTSPMMALVKLEELLKDLRREVKKGNYEI